MKTNIRLIALIVVLFLISCKQQDKNHLPVYSVEQNGEIWQLLEDGEPIYIKGAVAGNYFDRLKTSGANATRIWGNYDQRIKAAGEQGLVVLVSLPVRGERNGMNWEDTAMVEKNIERVMDVVEKFKDNPAVLGWGIGNELDWIPPGVPYNPRLWDWIEEMAQRIKKTDPRHPVMTVIGNSDFDKKTREIASQCPSLDLIGLNLYGDFSNEVEILKNNWGKAYMVTEWGPHGHWQMPYTEWKAPMEESSSEKAEAYAHSYSEVILKDKTHCLGSFVFLWDTKQEITHTWYGMFSSEGLESESVEVMSEFWSGEKAPNTAPKVKELLINGQARQLNFYLEKGTECNARIIASDAEDELSYSWEIRGEVDPAPYAGIGEVPAEPVPGLIKDSSGPEITFTVPGKEGAYRLFAYCYDNKGHWAYINFPFFVGEKHLEQ